MNSLLKSNLQCFYDSQCLTYLFNRTCHVLCVSQRTIGSDRRYIFIYIYKEECLFVCSLYVSTPYNQMQRNFPQILNRPRGRSTSTFFSKKICHKNCYRRYMKLTNRISGFQKSRKIGSEGGQRPSERSSITKLHVVSTYLDRLLATGC